MFNLKKRNIVGFSLFFSVLILLKLFLGGPTFVDIGEEVLIELLFFAFISAIFMLLPCAFRIKNKKRLGYRRGKRVCLKNSITIGIIAIILNIVMLFLYNPNEIYSVDYIKMHLWLLLLSVIFAIFYYFINMCFWVYPKAKKQTNTRRKD